MSLFRDFFYFERLLPSKYQKKWCLISVKLHKKLPKTIPLYLYINHKDDPTFEPLTYLVSGRFLPNFWRVSLVYLPEKTNCLRIYPIAKIFNSALQSVSSVKIRALSRLTTALILIIINPFTFIKIFCYSFIHLNKRIRMGLLQNQQIFFPNLPYKYWYNLYENWNGNEIKKLYESNYIHLWPVFSLFTYYGKTMEIDWNNFYQHPNTRGRTTPQAFQAHYIILKNSNEILEEHSLAVFADQATRQHYPAALYADSDEINNLNEHSNPVFKQNFNLSILLTGFLTQDIWIIRKDIFDDFIKEFDSPIRSIYAIRMALALYLWKKNHFIYHVPLILSHRTAKVSLHDKNEIIEIIKIFKTELNWQFNVNTHTFPFDINYINYQNPVSLIIPTTLGSETIHQCITKLIKKTSYPRLEIILVISQNKPLTKQQEKFLSSFQYHKHLKVLFVETDQFNFSKSCNVAIRHSKYPFIALINDDIEPLDQNWLSLMMGHMQNEKVGAVGAKLFYPDKNIQHAGVIMGAANLCEHAGRFHKSDNFYLTHDHEVSAVTGACMVIRRQAFNDVNGFDETFEIAYNDIDFCLRLREKKHHIIQCQNAQLIHYESLSLGNHYKGERAGKERQEILSLKKKHFKIINHDPFYNPNYSLQRGRDYQLAFPPRISIPFGLTENNV